STPHPAPPSFPTRRSSDLFFAPSDDPGRNLWFVRDHLAIAAAKGWGDVAPFFIELEAPAPPSGWPRPGALKVNVRNEHLQYAIRSEEHTSELQSRFDLVCR